MSRILYLDCFSGASGDMIVGALIDAGVSFSEVEAVVKSLDLDGCLLYTSPSPRD